MLLTIEEIRVIAGQVGITIEQVAMVIDRYNSYEKLRLQRRGTKITSNELLQYITSYGCRIQDLEYKLNEVIQRYNKEVLHQNEQMLYPPEFIEEINL